MAVVVNGNPVWQFQHGLDAAQAVTVWVTTPAACEQPQGRVTKSVATNHEMEASLACAILGDSLSAMQNSLEQLNLQPSLMPGCVVTVTVGTQLVGDAGAGVVGSLLCVMYMVPHPPGHGPQHG